MKLLLDTHAVLWALSDPDRLSPHARDRIAHAGTTVAVSAASAWEIAIKRAAGKLTFDADLSQAIDDADFEELPITVAHALAAGDLPPLHKDPFDRMLVAQAMSDGWTLVTRDIRLHGYGVAVMSA